jgi:hypothetical protein
MGTRMVDIPVYCGSSVRPMGDKLLYCPFIFTVSQFRRRRLKRAFFFVGERNNNTLKLKSSKMLYHPEEVVQPCSLIGRQMECG